MLLPVMPPVSPMLAKPVTVIPPGASYEPKWDGFRALVFRDGDDVEFGSRNERPMTRYFPELVRAAKAELPPRCVVDGEIVLPTEQGLDFEALQLRLHPAASRVRLLAEHTPARFIAFDLLALGDDNLMDRPFSERRAALAGALGSGPSFHVTPATTDIATARRWFDEFEGAGLDGLIAKGLNLTYQPDKRVMFKIKHQRTADCVVAGYRLHKSGPDTVGSLLLGLYRADGELQMVGGAASFSVKDRLKLLADLEPLREGDEVREGDPSRWNSAADKRWIPVRPEKVCEVAYDQMEGNTDNGRRFRHAVKFMRWRPDREPSSCTFDQLDVPLNYDLYDVLTKEG
ncbi:ATP-dependent DNA ligase [Mycolicibacterium fortuitum]|uniref:ATP-dependent DNA ligase n=2 Tax=Mycolicibacterium fortuitum TaxID=1766 RepID=UPI0007EAE0BE|nr:ATP-dependent DNA ligase [Mycolicibacterium fortuitum]OBG53677.1 ATP-dependent DNA ligase [Mycolicibacterium fortuitum]